MRKPAKLKVPVEPKEPERFYTAHDEVVLFDPDELDPKGEVCFTGGSLIESIQNFAEDFDVSLDDVQVYSDLSMNSEWDGETYLFGDIRLRAECSRDYQADCPEWYAKKLARYEERMVKYRAKVVEYETAKPIHEAKMAEYTVWKAEREKQKELRLLRRLQKKYSAENYKDMVQVTVPSPFIANLQEWTKGDAENLVSVAGEAGALGEVGCTVAEQDAAVFRALETGASTAMARAAAYARDKNPGKYIDEALDEASSAFERLFLTLHTEDERTIGDAGRQRARDRFATTAPLPQIVPRSGGTDAEEARQDRGVDGEVD